MFKWMKQNYSILSHMAYFVLLLFVMAGCRTRNWDKRAGSSLTAQERASAQLNLVEELLQQFSEGRSMIFRCHNEAQKTQVAPMNFVAMEFSGEELSQDPKHVGVKLMQTHSDHAGRSQLFKAVGAFTPSSDGVSFTLTLPDGLLTAQQRPGGDEIETIISSPTLPDSISDQIMICNW